MGATPPGEAKAALPKGYDPFARTAQERAAHQRALDDVIETRGARLSKPIERFMLREMESVASIVEAGGMWQSALDQDAWTDLLYEEVWKDGFTDAANRTWDLGMQRAGKSAPPDMVASWLDIVLGILRNAGAVRVAGIIGTTTDTIVRLIDVALAEGLSTRDIAKRLRDAAPEITRARSLRIARTELHSALNAGTMQSTRDMLKETGLTGKKVWISTPDERTRTDHRGVAAVGVDDKFNVGGERLDHPGDPTASVGNIVNCRCAMATQLEEPEWMR